MSTKTIALSSATPDARVTIKDPSVDADRIYNIRVRTRSVKRRIREVAGRIDETQKAFVEAEGEAEYEAENAFMRAWCDMLNELLVPGSDDTIGAGDLLFQGWENEDVTDEQIIRLANALQEESKDPT